MRILEAYIATDPPPEEATVAARRKSYFTAFYQRFVKEGSGIMSGMLNERDSVLEPLAGQELIADLRGKDLDAAIEDGRPGAPARPRPAGSR